MFSNFLHWLWPFIEGMLAGIVSMTLHEVGHIVAALALGVRVKYVGLRWKGLYTVREAGPPIKNIFVSLAGPGTNFLLILLNPYSHIFALANFCMGVGNLIPIRGSDGSRVLDCLKEIRKEKAAHAAALQATK